jgi:antibiotic biosynthesis monooxygenase (ABM) superfamily enzyme
MSASPTAAPATGQVVTVVTQTRVQPEHADDFARQQQQINDVVARFPGFLDHQVLPPAPPVQPDWVIVQRFTSVSAARAWLGSKERQQLVATMQPWLIGEDDIHLIEDDDGGQPTAVSAIISMRIVPGQEAAYRAWGQRIASAQAQFPGFQGFKINPPIPGVQDDWVTVLQFDNETHLNAWMTSPERQALLDEANAFTTDMHYRTVRSGFEQWFRVDGAVHAPAWKQNMLVLLGLYPTVFLFGFFVGTPLITRLLGWPFWLALFVGNVASVTILNWLVPWISRRFDWWLKPAGSETQQRTLRGIAAVVALYALLLFVFSRFP